MQDKLATWCLFFPEPMSDADKANLLAAGIKRVQLFFEVANHFPDQLRWLAAHGISVILRIEEPQRTNASQVVASYYNASNHPRIVAKVAAIKQIVPVEAVIAGNEPEGEYDLRRSGDPKANWGDKAEPLFPMGRAWHHQQAVGKLRAALAAVGVPVVAPGWSHRRKTPRDDPEPGAAMWARVCTSAYNGGAAGSHDYAINWLGDEDYNRYLWRVGEELERIQGEVWINETQVGAHALSDVQRMQAVMSMYELLANQDWSGPIKSFCPFVSNGRADQEWSHMRMTDPAAYVELGQWLGQIIS